MRERIIIIPRNQDIKKRQATIIFEIHGELNEVRLIIKMLEEKVQFLLSMRPNDTGVINKPFPKFRLKKERGEGPGFKVFHEQISNHRGKGGAHSHTTILFKEFTFETKEGIG